MARVQDRRRGRRRRLSKAMRSALTSVRTRIATRSSRARATSCATTASIPASVRFSARKRGVASRLFRCAPLALALAVRFGSLYIYSPSSSTAFGSHGSLARPLWREASSVRRMSASVQRLVIPREAPPRPPRSQTVQVRQMRHQGVLEESDPDETSDRLHRRWRKVPCSSPSLSEARY